MRDATGSCRAPAATSGRRRGGLGESGGRLRGQVRWPLPGCGLSPAARLLQWLPGRWEATSGTTAGQRPTARGLGRNRTGRRVEPPTARAGALLAGRRLPGGSAELGTGGRRGGEGGVRAAAGAAPVRPSGFRYISSLVYNPVAAQ